MLGACNHYPKQLLRTSCEDLISMTSDQLNEIFFLLVAFSIAINLNFFVIHLSFKLIVYTVLKINTTTTTCCSTV